MSPKARLYTLRHYWGTNMVGVVDLRTLQDWLGHEKLETSEIYLHVRPEKLIEQAGRKSPL